MIPESLAAAIAKLYDAIQDDCLPGLWSRGVALARAGAVIEDAVSDDEIAVRVAVKDRPASPRVQLWPMDSDWYCDCGDRNESCQHVAAAVIAAKNGQLTPKQAPKLANEAARIAGPFIRYKFTRTPEGLSFDRFLVRGSDQTILAESLVAIVGGIGSGRIDSSALVASKEDFAVDGVLTGRKRGVLDAAKLKSLLTILSECTNIELEGRPVRASGKLLAARAVVRDEGAGFRVEPRLETKIDESFANGVALCGDVLRPLGQTSFEARTFSAAEAALLVGDVLPELERRMAVELATSKLPELSRVEPRVVLRLETAGADVLIAVPRLVYGDPPIAEWREGNLASLDAKLAPLRDRAAEARLVRQLQTELHLALGQASRFTGEGAVQFREAARAWEVEGQGAGAFVPAAAALVARLETDASGETRLGFYSGEGRADPHRVLEAWRQGAAYAPLLDGAGYAPLPSGWLERHGDQLEALLAARDARGGLPRYAQLALAQATAELGQPAPVSLELLRKSIESYERLPEAKLPDDLKAELRPYQRHGVNWLCFLREQELGALLADDMGLGKTLEALCAIRGRTLVVAPTSVLYGWAEQIARFRPALKHSIYHGAGRALDTKADVVLTTYAILRLDRERLVEEDWETVILDEAQTIKNPESQVARAAHALGGRFKIALTGTPIENRLEDLWSQFQFLNPGLLGSRTSFGEVLARDTKGLRERIRPFLLRRLKREVALELPPRTETTLYCELGERERAFYDTILAATRAEVLAQLEQGKGNVMQALEALLRLRQACCHPALVPGGAGAVAKETASSKIELLLERLGESIALGHRALVFSQWTSLLDLIEPHFTSAGISFDRLDGSTLNRQAVIDRFQNPDGPAVLLLSLKAGGVGLTLTAADHVYLLDPWWNPAVEDQAADRAHRIGQVNPVLIHRLVAKGSVEERILELQKSKLALAGAVLEGADAASRLTREDLIALLGAAE